MKVFGMQGRPEFMILRNMGMHRAVENNSGKYFTEDRMRPIVHTAGNLTQVVAPGASNKARYSFVLSTSAGSNDTILGAVAPDFPQFGPTNFFYQPLVANDGLMFPNFDNNKTATVISIIESPAGTFTVLFEMDQIGVVNGALTAGSYVDGTPIIISSSAHPSGSNMPAGRVRGVLEDSWVLQNVWTTHEIDGDAQTTRTWLTEESNGQRIDGYRYLGQAFAEFLQMAKIDDAIWDGPGQINPLLAATTPAGTNQNVNYKTEGMLQYARRKGTILQYPIGLLTPMWFDQVDDIVVQNYGPKYFMSCNSAAFQREIDWSLADYFKRTNINFVQAEAEKSLFPAIPGSGKSVKVGFQYMELNNRVYCFHNFYRFDDPRYLGAPGYFGRNFSFISPIGTKPDPRNENNMIPYIGFYYKAKGGYSRLDEVNLRLGATNGQHTQDADKNTMTFKSQIGAAHVGGENMVIAEGV
jgi:hypothetical protein